MTSVSRQGFENRIDCDASVQCSLTRNFQSGPGGSQGKLGNSSFRYSWPIQLLILRGKSAQFILAKGHVNITKNGRSHSSNLKTGDKPGGRRSHKELQK